MVWTKGIFWNKLQFPEYLFKEHPYKETIQKLCWDRNFVDSLLAISRIDLILKSGFPGGSVVKKIHLPIQEMQEMWIQIPGLRRFPGTGNGKSLQCSCLEYPMNRGAWWVTTHGFTKESCTTELLSTILKSTVIQHSSASRILKLRNPDPTMKQKVEKYLNTLVNRARKTWKISPKN